MSRITRNNTHHQPAGRVRLLVLVFLLGFCCLLIFGWVAFSELLYKSEPQPLDFNHRLHAKIADDGCNSCHFFRDDGRFSGIPEIKICMGCHQQVKKGGDNETRLIQDYILKKAEIPWQVYAEQPDSVFFSHAAHVHSAGLECATCHGDMGQSTSCRIYQENVISGYSRDIQGRSSFERFHQSPAWESMEMDDCAACHKKKKQDGSSAQTGRDGCLVCHK